MINAFDREEQATNEKAKIIVGVERLSTMFRSLLVDESKPLKISPLQTQILLFIAHHNAEQCTVSLLAQEFSITKPTVSDAVGALLKKRLLEKGKDPKDARSFSLVLTDSGRDRVESLSGLTARIESAIEDMEDEEISVVWKGLILLINKLQFTGAVPVRMCFTCEHFGENHKKGTSHYCNLVGAPLKISEIRIDCPEHINKAS